MNAVRHISLTDSMPNMEKIPPYCTQVADAATTSDETDTHKRGIELSEQFLFYFTLLCVRKKKKKEVIFYNY